MWSDLPGPVFLQGRSLGTRLSLMYIFCNQQMAKKRQMLFKKPHIEHLAVVLLLETNWVHCMCMCGTVSCMVPSLFLLFWALVHPHGIIPPFFLEVTRIIKISKPFLLFCTANDGKLGQGLGMALCTCMCMCMCMGVHFGMWLSKRISWLHVFLSSLCWSLFGLFFHSR